jgi:acetyl esterase/lipase
MTLRSLLFAFAVVVAAALIGGCSSLRLLDAFVPNDGYTLHAALPYGALERQKLDVYAPAGEETGAARPVVVFFYGGGWETGDRAGYRFVAHALTSQGFVAVVPDYRVYPEVLFPDFLNDAAKAVRWTQNNIGRFGGDPQRVFLMGHSAGAHIAAMLTLDEQFLGELGITPRSLRGIIGLAGPYDFLPLRSNTLKAIFGPEPERWRSQPINFVAGHNPPMLLITGTNDGTVSPGNSQRLAAKIKAHGGPVKLIEYPDMGHADVVVRLAAPFRGDGEVLRTVADFVRSHSSVR